jgi:hypothetical protein
MFVTRTSWETAMSLCSRCVIEEKEDFQSQDPKRYATIAAFVYHTRLHVNERDESS